MLLMQFYVLHNNSSSAEKAQKFHTSEDWNQQVPTYSILRLPLRPIRLCSGQALLRTSANSGQAPCCSSLTNFIYTKLATFSSRVIFI